MHYCSLSSYHCVVLFWDTDRARMVFLGYFPCNKHFGNLGTVTVNSRYQQTVLKGLTRVFWGWERKVGLCLQPVGVILMWYFSVTFPSLDKRSAFDHGTCLVSLNETTHGPEFLAYFKRKSLNRDGNFAKEICDSNKLVVIQTLLCISLQNSAP